MGGRPRVPGTRGHPPGAAARYAGAVSAGPRRRSRLLGLVRAVPRADGPRCNFCGASAAAVALVIGREPAQACICPDCVRRFAAQIGGGEPPEPAA